MQYPENRNDQQSQGNENPKQGMIQAHLSPTDLAERIKIRQNHENNQDNP